MASIQLTPEFSLTVGTVRRRKDRETVAIMRSNNAQNYFMNRIIELCQKSCRKKKLLLLPAVVVLVVVLLQKLLLLPSSSNYMYVFLVSKNMLSLKTS